MKTIVTIPTYDERDNITDLIRAISALGVPGLELLVIDDDSPDGTWRAVQEIAQEHPHVHLLLRKEDRGRGLAGIAGFQQALEMGAECVVEMDADFSHDPKFIPAMLGAIEECDVVLGSRFVAGGQQIGRGLIRRAITRLANLYIRLTFWMRVRDCNSGFRCYRSHVLRAIELEKVGARGPDIIQELLYKVHLKGFRIREVPITFVDRQKGRSKLTVRQLFRGYTTVLALRLARLLSKL